MLKFILHLVTSTQNNSFNTLDLFLLEITTQFSYSILIVIQIVHNFTFYSSKFTTKWYKETHFILLIADSILLK